MVTLYPLPLATPTVGPPILTINSSPVINGVVSIILKLNIPLDIVGPLLCQIYGLLYPSILVIDTLPMAMKLEVYPSMHLIVQVSVLSPPTAIKPYKLPCPTLVPRAVK